MSVVLRWVERRVRVGFEERLSGGYRFKGEVAERPLRIDLAAISVAPQAAELMRFAVLGGAVSATSLTPRAALRGGSINIDKHGLSYTLAFDRWLFRGTKAIAGGDWYASLTTLKGQIFEEGTDLGVADACARFDARGDVGWWLRRLRVGRSGVLAEPAA